MADIERQSGMDPAEGSREAAGGKDDLGREQPQFSHGGTGEPPQPRGGGITNRPLEEEEANQDAVPERGNTKSDEGRD